jgi:DNA-binding response OmpR family regulator
MVPTQIMLVDDDFTTTQLMKLLLEIDGFEVRVVPMAGKVLAEVKAERPDVVIMDVHLADANGLDVLRHLRAEAELDGLPVIMASGMDLEEQCKAAGATAFVLKPFPPKEMASVIQKVMQAS